MVYLHDAVENRLKTKWQLSSPILDCCFSSEPNVAYAGSLKNEVVRLDLTTGQDKVLGEHEDSVKCVSSCRTTGKFIILWRLY